MQKFCIKNEEKCNFVTEMSARIDIFSIFSTCFCLFVLAFGRVNAQQSSLRFDEYTFNFGSVREEGGKVSHSFTFRNEGDKPVVIISATSTCGCTVPSFSQRPVMPSGTGTVEISYDPMNRPGRFDKRVTVVTSEQEVQPIRLTVEGNVIAREKGVDETYPIYIGSGVRAETNFHSFSYVEHGKGIRTGIGLINTSDRTVRVSVSNGTAGGVYRVFAAGNDKRFPIELRAGERSEIIVECDLPEDSNLYGTRTETLVVDVNGRRSDAEIVVTGILIDNRESRADNAVPHGEFTTSVVRFGTLKHSDGGHTERFEVVNSGESALHVRAVEGCAEGTEFSLSAGDSIAAGERRSVSVTVHPGKKSYGPSVERVRVITDDPLRPMRDLKISMIVEE